MHRFTPKLNGVRVEMELTDEDARKIGLGGRRLGVRGVVVDQITQKRYRVVGVACSLPNCNCDAEVFPV